MCSKFSDRRIDLHNQCKMSMHEIEFSASLDFAATQVKMNPPKRPKKSLNLQQKVEILSKLDKGVHGSVLAAEYEVAKSTISYIKSQKSDILSSVTNTKKDVEQKRLRKTDFPELEDQLYSWFRDQRERNCAINGVLLKAKAKELFLKVYPDKGESAFQASDHWFHNFKKRVGIRYLKICGEQLDCDEAAVRPFLNRLNAKIEEMNLTKEQIYNADETGLNYRLLPESTYVSQNEKAAAGHKKSKERVSILLCSNASGTHKVKPLVIGKSRKPRCFKNFKNPLDYNNSQKAWMTLNIFTHWFHTCFVKQVRSFCTENNLPKKAILLVDNCSAHGSAVEPLQSDGNQIVCYFLPPNVTAILQPMDQGPIKLTKLKYRSLLICKIISEMESYNGTIVDLLKNHTIKDMIILLKKAWDDVSSTNLSVAWKKVLQYDDNEFESEDLVPLSELSSYSSLIQQTQAHLKQLDPNVNCTNADIEQWNNDVFSVNDSDEAENPGETDDDDEDDEQDGDCTPVAESTTSHSSALVCVNQLLKWCEQNQSTQYMTGLLDLRKDIVSAANNVQKKQTHIFEYFAKQ